MKRALLIGVGTLFAPALALAQSAPSSEPAPHAQTGLDPNAPPPGVHVIDEAEPKIPALPRAADLLGSHVLLGAAVGPAWSLGKLGSSLGSARGFGTGFGARADVGFGLGRSVLLGVWGSLASYVDGDSCGTSCAGRSFAIGPFVRYHLAQGLRFDPWLTLGAGYRQLSFDTDTSPRQKFKGLEWLHFELGADYYVFSGLGLGPYAALSLSSYTTRPSSAGDVAVNTELSTGIRFLFDLPGR